MFATLDNVCNPGPLIIAVTPMNLIMFATLNNVCNPGPLIIAAPPHPHESHNVCATCVLIAQCTQPGWKYYVTNTKRECQAAATKEI